VFLLVTTRSRENRGEEAWARADSIVLGVILTPKQTKEQNEMNGEMISLSGNQTVPLWAIAALTMGKVKEIDDDDKRTCKEKSKTIDETQDLSRL